MTLLYPNVWPCYVPNKVCYKETALYYASGSQKFNDFFSIGLYDLHIIYSLLSYINRK